MTCQLNEHPELREIVGAEHTLHSDDGTTHTIWHYLAEGYEPHDYVLCAVAVQLLTIKGVDFDLNPPEQSWTPAVQRERGVVADRVIDLQENRGGPVNGEFVGPQAYRGRLVNGEFVGPQA